jgi:hypothetical protein
MGMYPAFPASGAIAHPHAAFVGLSMEGAGTDTVWTPADAAAGCTTLSERAFRAGFWEDRRAPFVPKTTWALGPDGTFAVGCPANYALDLHHPSGRVTRIIREWQPQAMPDEAREALSSQARLAVLPRHRPAYSRIILPGDGRVWVWPNQPFVKVPLAPELAERFGMSHRWQFSWSGAFDVFAEDGAWLATVRLPSGARFNGFPTEPGVKIRGDTMWAVSVDDLGVQTIVRYEVPELSRTPR